jgi:multidrug transporter EmrE-like cation transporter
MKITLLLAVLVSVFLSAAAQILMKSGMTDARVLRLIAAHDFQGLALAIASSVGVVGGLLTFGLSVVLWLYVLSSVPLSTAYPFVALGICITTFAGYALFGDAITGVKLVGVALIVCGICLIAIGA